MKSKEFILKSVEVSIKSSDTFFSCMVFRKKDLKFKGKVINKAEGLLGLRIAVQECIKEVNSVTKI